MTSDLHTRLALSDLNGFPARSTETRQAIAQQGAIDPLIALLKCDGQRRSSEYAAAALSELSHIPANKVAIDKGGGITPLVALLGDDNLLQASKGHAAATLARLATEILRDRDDSLTNKRRNDRESRESKEGLAALAISMGGKIASAGAIPPLVGLLSGDMGDEAQEEAAGALLALAETEQSRRLMTDAGGIAPLVLLLGSLNDKARGYAEGALVRLSIEKSTRVIIIQRLVGMLLPDTTSAAKEQATAALVNLARESTENRMSILEAGAIPKLLSLLEEGATKVVENAVSALSQLAFQNRRNQSAIANANGVAVLVQTLTRNAQVKDAAGNRLSELTAEAIWNMASDNKHNQSAFLKEGANPTLVALITNPNSKLQTNAAGALAALAKEHPENQAAIAKSGAIPPICTNVRDGSSATKEESAAALWALSTDNHANKTLVAQLGGVDPLISMLLFGSTDKSSANAAGALAALATDHPDNRSTITKKLVAGLDGNAPPARAVRFLNAVFTLCDNEAPNQETYAKAGGIQNIIAWNKVANTTEETVRIPAAKAMLAVVGNNRATQSLAGKLGGIPPLVELLKISTLEGQEHATCALWHLATLADNRIRIYMANAIPPLVKLLRVASNSAPQLAAMLLLRLAEGSSKAAASIAKAGGIKPLVSLLHGGTPATQQMAAGALAAIGLVAENRDLIASAGAVVPLVKLLYDKTMGTPETAARVLANLAREDTDEDRIGVPIANAAAEPEDDGNIEEMDDLGEVSVADLTDEPIGDETAEKDEVEEERDDRSIDIIVGIEQRRMCIKQAKGMKALISMLDGSNLNPPEPLKPATIGGWTAVGVGVQGCIELDELFVGSNVSFGARIGMQEQVNSMIDLP